MVNPSQLHKARRPSVQSTLRRVNHPGLAGVAHASSGRAATFSCAQGFANARETLDFKNPQSQFASHRLAGLTTRSLHKSLPEARDRDREDPNPKNRQGTQLLREVTDAGTFQE